LGRDADEQVRLATAHGVFKDFHITYTRLVYGNYNEQNTYGNALKEALKNFEAYLKKLKGLLGKDDYIAGKLTWMDFVLADFLQTLALMSSEILNSFPELVEYQKRVWGLP
jgi:glutathione S-transferase